MFRWLICALALTLFATPAAAPAADRPQVEISVTRAENGEWLVEYRFGPEAPVWFFPRSSDDNKGGSWRVKSWTVETPGVKLQRSAGFDRLDGGGKPLTSVRIRIRPYVDLLPSDFTPAVRFSDGSLAFLSDNFMMLPVVKGRTNVDAERPVTRIAFNDPGRRLLLRGKAAIGTVSLLMDSGNTYVYAGDTPVVEAPNYAGVLDAGLPAWIRTEVNDFTPRLLQFYTRKLGPSRDARPLAMVAWGGATDDGWMLGGRVLEGMIMIQISGQSARWRDSKKLDTMREFIGHEAAHFWLGRTVRTSNSNERWITEGGADFLATRALEEMLPDYDVYSELRRMMNECLMSIRPNQSLSKVGGRVGNNGYYGCGAMLALAAEHATKQRYPRSDSFEFIRSLILANRRDEEVTAEDWLARFQLITRDPALTEDVRVFIKQGHPDPKAFFRRLFRATGVPLAVEEIPIKEQMRE
ncbi:M1 family aminopeptidase [Sphingomonas sp. G-3-2-10]|uniref:M1 family aminopeptidase n=1 Tax=Sphingomonas sp. G-3-2-10 TaxID=2728838 RepID=UPI00146F5007|nr:M1 family aminopeptidase [Sphingomonas sp. G-3-2-10]NML05472.1 hypothetical protein [Sphingomonas sp. G-3-2-10]